MELVDLVEILEDVLEFAVLVLVLVLVVVVVVPLELLIVSLRLGYLRSLPCFCLPMDLLDGAVMVVSLASDAISGFTAAAAATAVGCSLCSSILILVSSSSSPYRCITMV